MITTPTIDPAIVVARPSSGRLPTLRLRAAVGPYAADTTVATATPSTTVSMSSMQWSTDVGTIGTATSETCGFVHLVLNDGNGGTDGSKRLDPGHLVGGLT